jgi:hypothetical protein
MPFVIYDRDGGNAKAEKVTASIEAVVGKDNIVQLVECLEEELNYATPVAAKPSTTYSLVKCWGDKWSDVPERWRLIMERAFEITSTGEINKIT